MSLGVTLRRLRTARGLTQRQLAGPLTASFVSAVETGRTVPSLAALCLLAARMDMSAAEVLLDVNAHCTSGYTERREDGQAAADSR
ncbi:MAG TPA: helix-turn-helix transcriptional regulator [Candidatus Limnocylindria bacterium]|nr:helix-turn-helix transcriptional regulator [Candidatus Limnocylindria bacterium]